MLCSNMLHVELWIVVNPGYNYNAYISKNILVRKFLTHSEHTRTMNSMALFSLYLYFIFTFFVVFFFYIFTELTNHVREPKQWHRHVFCLFSKLF